MAPAPKGATSAAAPGSNRVVWWGAGAALVGLVLIVAWPVIRQDQVAPTGGPGGSAMPPGAGPSTVDLSTMSPRDAADRLFRRVMSAAEAGDTAEAVGFLPMAISAYEMVNPPDADTYFHVALLKEVGHDYEGALEAARQGLEGNPDHLLNLAAAGEAARGAGDDEAAREYYQHLLDVWDTEQAKQLEEYELHRELLPNLRQEAATYLGR